MYREDVIIPLVKNKKVLDCGGIDHWATELKISRGDWLHETIAKHAESCLGIDILEENVNKINSQGKYRFLTANAESLPFENEFDVIVAGEIVEHIYNMGLFLDSAWKSLKKDGILIITTPNNYALSSILYAIFFGKERCHPEHTCYYSQQTLSYIVKKHGFEIEKSYILSRPAHLKIISYFSWLFCKIRPNTSEQLVVVARKFSTQDKYIDKW